MKKIINWVLNHFVLVAGVLTLVVMLAVIGGSVLSSKIAYSNYEKRYDAIDLEVRSASPASPGYIEFNNSFKSKYRNRLELAASQLTVSTTQEEYMTGDYIDLTTNGGKVSTKLTLEEMSFVDIDFQVATTYVTPAASEDEEDQFGIKDLISNVKFTVNGEDMEEKGVDLVKEGLNHLIMARFALPAGEVTVSIENLSGKAAMMPQLKAITFFSTQKLAVAEEAPQA